MKCLERYQKELLIGTLSGTMKLDVKDFVSTTKHLEEYIIRMQRVGDQLAETMETVAVTMSYCSYN